MHSDIQTAAVTIINVDVTPFIVYSSKYKPARVMPWVSPYSKGEDVSHISCVPPTYLYLCRRSKLYTTRAVVRLRHHKHALVVLLAVTVGVYKPINTPIVITCPVTIYFSMIMR